MLNINNVSKVKNIKVTKEMPTPNKINIVYDGLILIFLKEYVGILLISKKATNNVISGENLLMSKNILKSDNCATKGDKISIAPNGDGTPSK